MIGLLGGNGSSGGLGGLLGGGGKGDLLGGILGGGEGGGLLGGLLSAKSNLLGSLLGGGGGGGVGGMLNGLTGGLADGAATGGDEQPAAKAQMQVAAPQVQTQTQTQGQSPQLLLEQPQINGMLLNSQLPQLQGQMPANVQMSQQPQQVVQIVMPQNGQLASGQRLPTQTLMGQGMMAQGMPNQGMPGMSNQGTAGNIQGKYGLGQGGGYAVNTTAMPTVQVQNQANSQLTAGNNAGFAMPTVAATAAPQGQLQTVANMGADADVQAHGHAHADGEAGANTGGGLLGGLLGGGAGGNDLLGGLLGGGAGGAGGNAGGGMLGGLGTGLLGPAFNGVHGLAENLIDAVGMQELFAPIDEAIIHPILWDPLTAITGYDVSNHPEGIKDIGEQR